MSSLFPPEPLPTTEAPPTSVYDTLPSYMVAASSHNDYSSKYSIVDYLKGTIGAVGGAAAGAATGFLIGGPVGSVIGGIAGGVMGVPTAITDGKYLAASAVSGAYSFANTGIQVTNWFTGRNYEELSVEDKLTQIDSDLGNYYQENRMSSDLTGFLVGSLVPTAGALKVYNASFAMLNAAKAGKVGSNMSSATGLLGNTQAKYLAEAVKDIGSRETAFGVFNTNYLKALTIGVADEAAQGAVVSAAILGTMKASPLLTDMDFGDMVSNVAEGALIGGAVGGLVRGARMYFDTKKGVLALETAARPYADFKELGESLSPADKLINILDQKYTLPKVVEGAENAPFQQIKLDQNVRKMNNDLMIQGTELAGGNTANASDFVALTGLLPIDDAFSRLQGLKNIGNITEVTAQEKLVNQLTKKRDKGLPLTPDELDTLTHGREITYLTKFGPNSGKVSTAIPAVTNVADKLISGQTLTVSAGAVTAGKRTFNFSTKLDRQEDFLDVVLRGLDDADAAYSWAYSKSGAALKNGMEIKESALHLIKAAHQKGLDEIVLVAKDGTKRTVSGQVDMDALVVKSMQDFHYRASTNNKLLQEKIFDPLTLELKLKNLTGLHFSVDSPAVIGEGHNAWAWTYRGTGSKTEIIHLNKDKILDTTTDRTLGKWLSTLKHEEGHNQYNLIASVVPGYGQSSVANSAVLAEVTRISKIERPHMYDGAGRYLGGDAVAEVQEKMADTFAYFSLRPHLMKKLAPAFYAELGSKFLKRAPDAALDLIKNSKKFTNLELAHILDMDIGFLELTSINPKAPLSGLFQRTTAAKDFTEQLIATKQWDAGKGIVETFNKPQTVKLVRDTTPVLDLNDNVLKGMAAVKEKQRLAKLANVNATTSVWGDEIVSQLPEIPEAAITNTTKQTTQSAATAASGDPGTTGSFFQWLGLMTEKMGKFQIDKTTATIANDVAALQRNQKAAVEFSGINAKLRATGELYYPDPMGSQSLVRFVGRDKNGGKLIDESSRIAVKETDTWNAINSHITRNGERVLDKGTIVSANGSQQKLDPNAFYPMPANPRDYPYFAFVVDPTITSQNRVQMVYAGSEPDLDAILSQIRSNHKEFEITGKNTQLKTLSKKEVEDFYKAQGTYKADDVISENYINTALKRTGVSSAYAPQVDQLRIADDFLGFHLEKDRQLARYGMTTHYQKEFAELKRLGDSATNLATSTASAKSLAKFIEAKVDNPFQSYIKTALNITDTSAMPLWSAIGDFADTKFSEIYKKIKATLSATKTAADLDVVNDTFKRLGLNVSYYNASLAAHVGHTAPKNDLNVFIGRGNAIIASTVLRLDPMNAVNNIAGSPILTFMESNSVLNKMLKGDPTIGALAGVKLPGVGDSVFSTSKLWAKSVQRFFTDASAREWAKKHGFSTRHLSEFESILDDLALRGTETSADLSSRMNNAYAKFMGMMDTGEKITGNRLAESFNRFVAADMMKQITDVAVSKGLMTEAQALPYINTFVNRTQGNYNAAQRPFMFQGPLGQTIGLFQTYQFNMLQNVFRYVGEGSAKTAALGIGLQSSIYGVSSLPGFDYINAHVVGTMSGNKNNRDLYDAAYGINGKATGDYLTYGFLSNTLGIFHPDLKANIYSRGDVNPRFLTVVPINPLDTPIVQYTGKLLSSMKETATKVAQGGNVWSAVLQGIEHSGVNRPLMGLAQTLQALGQENGQSYSTSNKGNIISSNDLMSLANIVRITGARPYNEALAIESAYRLDVYKDLQNKKRRELGETIKTVVLSGGEPSEDQMNSFAARYAESGGNQENFIKYYMDVYKNTTTSQANKIAEHLKSPYSESMQRILGGHSLRDFSNSPQ